jgi:hypothetical protein
LAATHGVSATDDDDPNDNYSKRFHLPSLDNPRPPSPRFWGAEVYAAQKLTHWDHSTERLQRPLPQPLPADYDEAKELLPELEMGVLGCITASMVAALCRTCQFYLLGGYGMGRCLFSAFFNAIGNGPNRFARVVQQEMFDDVRTQLRRLAETLSGAALKRVQEDVFNTGNCGGAYDDDEDEDDEKKTSPPVTETIEQRQQREHQVELNRAWKTLLTDLSDVQRPLGWDALVLFATHYQLNILVFVHMKETQTFDAGTEAARKKWADEKKEGRGRNTRQKKPRKWVEVTVRVTPKVVCERIRPDVPFVILYHRADVQHTVRLTREKTDLGNTSPLIGHYEAVVATLGGDDSTTHGLITITHPAYPDLLDIATRALSISDM